MFDTDDFVADTAFAGVAETIDRLRRESRAEWCSAARSQRVKQIGQSIEALHAEFIRAVEVWDGAGDHAAEGALSSTAWLTQHVPMTRAAASRAVSAARMIRRSEPLAAALHDGRTTVAHLEQAARAVHGREDIFETHGTSLVDAAIDVSPEDFRECAASWRAKADDLIGALDDPFDDARDELILSPTTGGLGLRGWFHSAAGVEIMNLIDTYDHPDPVDGDRPPRTIAQRRAAALYALLFDGRALSPKQVDVVIDKETLRAEWTADLARTRTHVEGYGPVPCSLIRSWLTEATLRRIVSTESEILDVGRSARLATPAQRRALRHRDGGCVIPGCRRPPQWTDAHHVVTYLGGGLSDLANFALVCRRHHRMLDRGWMLTGSPVAGWEFSASHDQAPP